MSRRRKAWWWVAVCLALVVLFPLGPRWRAQWNLHAYRQKLIAAGEKLSVEEVAPTNDPHATNTEEFVKLGNSILNFGDYFPAAMRCVKPGVACVNSRQAQMMEGVLGIRQIDFWTDWRDKVRKNEGALAAVQALVARGGIQLRENYGSPNVSGMTMLFLVAQKNIVRDLNASALLSLHDGKHEEALAYLTTAGAAANLAADEPLEICQRVRCACLTILMEGTWEALQYGGWTDEQLAQLQRQWEGWKLLRAAAESLQMERARMPMWMQWGRKAPQGFGDLFGSGTGIKPLSKIWQDSLLNAREGVNELLSRYPRYWGWKWIWSYRDEQRCLEVTQSMIEALHEAQRHTPILFRLGERDRNHLVLELRVTKFDVAEAIRTGQEKFIAVAVTVQTEVGMVTAAIALERYRLARHSYPKALRELEPEFLREIPVDCMDGQDLRYRLNPDGSFLLYSVGEDGVDNGGDATPGEGKKVGFLNGRDWVWPRAATDEEVRAYEDEQRKPAKMK